MSEMKIQSVPDLIKKRKGWVFLILAVLILLGLLPRIWMISKISENDFLHNDGSEYREISSQLSKGNGFSLSYYRWYELPNPERTNDVHQDLSRPPLLPLIGAGLYFLPFDWIISAKVICILLGALSIFAVFRLGSEIFDPVCGLISAALFAVYPYGIYYSICWSTENLFLILLCFSFLYFIKSLKRDSKLFLWSALFLFLAMMTRPTAILLVPLYLSVQAVFYVIRKEERKNILRYCVLFVLLFSLLSLPWTVRNCIAGGKPTPLTYYDGYAFWLSSSEIIYETYLYMDTPLYQEKIDAAWKRDHEARLKELETLRIYDTPSAAKYWKKWGWEYISENPGKMIYILKERFFHYFRMCPNLVAISGKTAWMLRIFFSILFASALWTVYVQRRNPMAMLLLLFPAFGLFISIPFLFVLRYRYPFFAPYVCVLAGFAFYCLLQKWSGMKRVCSEHRSG